jgi:hypothetical protein
MSFVLNGSGHLLRVGGGVTSLAEFTILGATKRTSTQTGNRALASIRTNGETSGHNILLYNGGFGSDAAPVIIADYGLDAANPNVLMPLDEWQWWAIVGDGTTITLYQLVDDVWESDSCSQGSWTPNRLYLGDTNLGTERLTAKYAHIREWNAIFNEAQLLAETNSNVPVITTDLVSSKSGLGANLTAALLGQSGTTFTTSGTVTLDTDEPTFSATADIIVSQTLADFSKAVTASTINEAAVAQTVDDFTAVVELGGDADIDADVAVAQSLGDFTKSVTVSVDGEDPEAPGEFTFTVVLSEEAVVSQTISDFTQFVSISLGIPAELNIGVIQGIGDFSNLMVIQNSTGAPARPEYNTVTCGPGELGTPVRRGIVNVRKEYSRPWPTK